MRWSRVVVLVAVALVALPAGTSVADAPSPDGVEPSGPVQPYFKPPFAKACEVHSFREGQAPDPADYPDDPLCVEYAKRDITVDNGGAIGFLLAEPARFVMAGPKCQYWQQDHWSVQFSRGDTPVVRWDGSYWFDKGSGQAAGRLSRVRVGGQPVSVRQAAAAVEEASPELAAYLRRYARGGNGMGYDGTVPFDPRCS